MDFLGRIDQLIRNLDASPTVEAAAQVLCTYANPLGFEWLSYMLLVPPAGGPPGRFVITTYPPEWRARYAGEGYVSHDMVLRHAMRTARPFRWVEIGRIGDFTSEQQRVFHEAFEVGIRSGGTVPIHGPGQAKAQLTVASRLPDAQFAKLFAARRHELHLVATYLHERLLQLRGRDGRPAGYKLTPRELEVMTWTARGKTSEDIGQILAISDETVMKHIRNACSKLNASNKTHATAVAVLHGLIVP